MCRHSAVFFFSQHPSIYRSPLRPKSSLDWALTTREKRKKVVLFCLRLSQPVFSCITPPPKLSSPKFCRRLRFLTPRPRLFVRSRAIAEAVVSLVRSCWESAAGGAAAGSSEVVPVSAGRLLLSLTTVLPPAALEGSQAVAALLKDAGQVWCGAAVHR